MMMKHKVGCLPVIKNKKLVGIVTEHDFVDISHRLIKELSSKND
jgi:CBS domain-containing protein